jgi:preprotein translocase subunit SecE
MANALVQYFIDAKAELKKVTWPTRKETLKASLLVIILSIITAAFLGAVDYVLNLGLERLLYR